MVDAYNLSNLEPLFKNQLLAENISAVTQKNYLSDIRHFLGWLGLYNKENPSNSAYYFDKRAIEEYINYLKTTAVPDKTLNRRLSTLRKFCLFCFNSGLIEANYLARTNFLLPNTQLNPQATQINLIKHEFTYLSGQLSGVVDLFKNHVVARYVFFALVVLLLSAYVSIGTLSRRDVKSAFPSIDKTGRVLTFQASLTDKLGNPIDTKTDTVFRLYTKESGGTPLYIGKCVGEGALTPDIHGVFRATIGKDCGMQKIPADVFIDNPNLYLGIAVGSDPEMQPRQKIANVGTASSAQSLSGLPLGVDTNSVPYIDENGVLAIAAVSPSIESTSGNFTIKGTTLTLTTSKSGDIQLSPSAGGNVFITEGNVGIGSSLPPSFKLELSGNFGPSVGYSYDIGSPSKQWANLYAEKLYQNNYEVCDTSGNCSAANGWNVVGKKVFLNTALLPTKISTDEAAFDIENVRLGIGTGSPTTRLHVTGATTGKALTILDETGDQNILVASASGQTKFVLGRDGRISVGKNHIGDGRQIDTGIEAFLSTSGVWTDASSRDWKNGFTDLDYTQILDKVKNLPITRWSYNSDPSSITHIGPLAEDFYGTFGVGNDNKHIAALDSAGIALAAVKGLSQINERNLSTVQGSINNLSQRINNLEETNANYIYNGLFGQSKNILPTSIYTFGDLLANTLNSNILTAEDAIVHNSLLVKNITTDSLLALNSHIDNLTTNLLSVREKISSPVVETKDIIASGEAKIGKIKTNQIDTNSDNLTIDLDSNSANNNTNKATNVENRGQLAELIIKGLGGKVVGSIDEVGNATFSGNLEAGSVRTDEISTNLLNARTATIDGSLIAKTIKSDNIDQLTNDLKNTQNTLSTHETDLQQLSSSVNEVQKILAELKNQPINSENYQSLMDALTLSLNNVVNPNDQNSPNSTVVGQKSTDLENLSVLGSANIYKAGITDSLTVGDVFVRDNSILSLSWDLNISALSNINFFGGMLSLHKDGNLITNGQVIALGGVQTNSLSSIGEGNDINIQLKGDQTTGSTSKVAVRDNQNNEVASIDTKGDAYFNSLGLEKYKPKNNSIITASDNFSQNGQYTPAFDTKSYAAGEGILPANSPEVIVYNDRIQDGSLVYLTSTGADTSVHLSIVGKKSCSTDQTSCKSYFKIGSDKVSPTPTTFNWLLVN